MATSKINRRVKSNPDTGFGTQAGSIGGRFINRDGSFNLRKTGWPFWKRVSVYSYLLELSWSKFLAVIILFYVLANFFFTGLYLLIGLEQLHGYLSITPWGKIKETFFFSTQTFTTVGYGRINPGGDGADLVASIETMCGWLFFALVTGLLYGRFTRPKAYIAFSDVALISPYRNGIGLMFRMVPYKNIHQLTDARVAVNLSMLVSDNGKSDYEFYQLPLERSRVDMFNMNWTVVHPINEESPLYNFTMQDLASSDFELMVQVSGFDPVFSNQVMQRTSYTMKELVWGAKFSSMYHQDEDGDTTVLELDKLSHYEKADLPVQNLQTDLDAIRAKSL
ncbi:MAG TPA: ion channel [Flavisolibacter sp.]|nr:ion channel [Flavisolibacter sp.]